MKCKIILFLLFLFAQLHAAFRVSDESRFAEIKLFAKDSLQINKFKNENHTYQNSVTFGLFLNGLATPHISFNALAEVNTDMAKNLNYYVHNYDPYFGYPYDILSEGEEKDNGRTWAFFKAHLNWKTTNYLKISGGYDYLSYGPARRNKLTLRGEDFYFRSLLENREEHIIKKPVPTPFLGFDLELAFITYSQHILQLKNQKDFNRYLHAHRLNFKVSKSFSFGLTETIVYGSTDNLYGNDEKEMRSMEAIYLVPFVPYMFVEYYTGDRENKAISMDFSWKIFNLFELYGELFIDDLFTITSFFDDDWWGNKWATSLGVAVDSAKVGSFNWDFNLEYTRIEPWVYTHHKGKNNEYSHFGNSLGSDLGSNSREIYSRIGLYKDFWKVDLSVSSVAKDTAFGGNIHDIHKEGDPTDKKYLNPKTTIHYREYGASVLFKPFSIWHIGAKQYIIFDEYKGNRTEVFSRVLF